MPKGQMNRWHEIILQVLREAGEPLTVKRLAEKIEARRFAHKSTNMMATIGGRLAELRTEKLVERVGVATYAVKPPEPIVVQSIDESLRQLTESSPMSTVS